MAAQDKTKTPLTDTNYTEARTVAHRAASVYFGKMSRLKIQETYMVADEVLRGLVHHGMTVFFDPQIEDYPRLVLDQVVQPNEVYSIEDIMKSAMAIASFHIPTTYMSSGGARQATAQDIARAIVTHMVAHDEIVYQN